MTLRIHNSLTGLKHVFEPLVPNHVRMYVCGITVYDFIHIGHARMLVVFDVVYRYLRHRGYEVTYVRNITDIDDKIIQRAARNGESIEAVTARYIHAMHEDCALLALVPPDHEPRATAHLPQIISMIERLVEGGYAYRAENGDVLYSVAKFGPYGRLSGKRLADLRAGARVEISEAKRDPLDFVLWKSSKPGEPAWESPWGPGRPGWHIECSAMSTAILGTHFDIHGGGIDLKFPHHENEIAQSQGATGDAFVNVWMHNGFVNVNEEKMSKSLGNFFTVREVLPSLRDPEVLRYFILSSHYRGPINYSIEQLEQADAALGRIYTALRDLPLGEGAVSEVERSAAEEIGGAYAARFREAMDDDFNTAEAFAVLQTLTREINAARAAGRMDDAVALARELRSLAAVLGIAQLDPADWFRRAAHGVESAGAAIADDEIERLIAARRAARQARDWKESDRIRDELAARGVALEDKPGGATSWRRV